MGRFVTPCPLQSTILGKAAQYTAAEKIEGSYFEFGVFQGHSFITAYECLSRVFRNSVAVSDFNTPEDRAIADSIWRQMQFYAFDSFAGLPAPKGKDRESRDFTAGKFSAPKDLFLRNLAEAGVPRERVQVIEGWYDQVLKPGVVPVETKAAIVHIDCDYYESAKTVLNFITPHLTDGAVLIFDDWFRYHGNPNFGEQSAFREWQDQNPAWGAAEYQREGAWKNSFIVYRR